MQKVLEGCLARLPHGYRDFGVACLSRFLDARLIPESRTADLCNTVRLLKCTATVLQSPSS